MKQNDKPGSLNPNITASPTAFQTTAVTPTPAPTTSTKTLGFEIALAVVALLAIYTTRKIK